MKKSLMVVGILGSFLAFNSFAGNNDWEGVFNFQDEQGKTQTVLHTPSKVSFLFFNIGGCLSLKKGSKINGMEMKEDINLCTKSNIATFTNEVGKLGLITKKDIVLGSNYQDE